MAFEFDQMLLYWVNLNFLSFSLLSWLFFLLMICGWFWLCYGCQSTCSDRNDSRNIMKSSLSKIDNQENKQTKWKREIEGDIRRDKGNNRGKIGKSNMERNERSVENKRGRLTKNGAAGMQKESSVKWSKNTITS